jgi:hypothetical protein
MGMFAAEPDPKEPENMFRQAGQYAAPPPESALPNSMPGPSPIRSCRPYTNKLKYVYILFDMFNIVQFYLVPSNVSYPVGLFRHNPADFIP